MNDPLGQRARVGYADGLDLTPLEAFDEVERRAAYVGHGPTCFVALDCTLRSQS